MPITPDSTQVKVNRPLTNVSVAWMQEQPGVAQLAFPTVPVRRQGDLYYTYDRGDWFKALAEKRAPGTESAGGGWNVSTDSFFCHVRAVHQDLDDQTLANADEMFNLEADAARWTAQQIQLRQEIDWVAANMATSRWTGTSDEDQAGAWATTSTDIIGAVRSNCTEVKNKTGFRPNILIVDDTTWDYMVLNDDILDRIKYTQTGIVTRDLVARVMDIDQILVVETVYSADGGDDLSSVGPTKGGALLLYRPPRPGLRTPAAGYTFTWTGLLGAEAGGVRTKRFRMEELESWRIEGESAYDQKQVAADLGSYLYDTHTT